MLLALTVVFGVIAVASAIVLLYRPADKPATRRDKTLAAVHFVSDATTFTLLAIHWLSD